MTTKRNAHNLTWVLSTFIIFIVFVLVIPISMAEDAEVLYPIRENGLWGYINRAGDVLIEPQWDEAEPFNEGIAVVGTGGLQDRLYGLIDRDGTAVVPVRYAGMKDCGAFCLFGDEAVLGDGKIGWYDKAGGFCQDPVYDDADGTPTDSGLIFVSWYEDEDRSYDRHHDAYMDRSSGKTAIPFDYIGENYTEGTFHEGYAYWLIENDEGFDAFLIDLTGRRVVFPNGIVPDGDVCEGVLRIVSDDGVGNLSGLARPDGTVIFTMTKNDGYLISDASEGRVFFERDANQVGIMDLEGNVILPAVLDYDPGWFHLGRESRLFFRNGYALIMLCDEDNHRSYVFVDREGGTVFRMDENPAPGIHMYPCTFAMENGLAWYTKSVLHANGEYETGYGLIRLTESAGGFLTEPVYDHIPAHPEGMLDFSEGVTAVSQNGLWGYIDETAQWVIPPQYDSADHFRDGLALVEKDGKLRYIDHAGNAVWSER